MADPGEDHVAHRQPSVDLAAEDAPRRCGRVVAICICVHLEVELRLRDDYAIACLASVELVQQQLEVVVPDVRRFRRERVLGAWTGTPQRYFLEPDEIGILAQDFGRETPGPDAEVVLVDLVQNSAGGVDQPLEACGSNPQLQVRPQVDVTAHDAHFRRLARSSSNGGE